VALIFKSFDIYMYIFFLLMGEGEGNRVIFKILTYRDEVKGSNAIELLTAVVSRPKKRKVAALPNDAPKCQGKKKNKSP
jgi:hypothetical protein